MSLLLKNRYKILEVLSDAGGFGQTLLAEDIETPSHRRCVIKKLKPRDDNDEYQFVLERFHREAAILERLGDSSDQIPKLYAYFVENHEFYLVQELVEGLTLDQKVKREGVLSEEKVREFLSSILEVLDFVHKQNIIHRDIKPGNIIFRQRDDKPVLIDFGIVKEILNLDVEGNPTSSIAMGTPGYSPLEQTFGKPVFASDLFSLGATAIYLLTGKHPNQITDPATGKMNWRQYASKVSDNFAAVLDKATQLFADNRYKTVQEMREDLHECFIEKKEAPAPIHIVSPLPKPKSSIKTTLLIFLFLAIPITLFPPYNWGEEMLITEAGRNSPICKYEDAKAKKDALPIKRFAFVFDEDRWEFPVGELDRGSVYLCEDGVILQRKLIWNELILEYAIALFSAFLIQMIFGKLSGWRRRRSVV